MVNFDRDWKFCAATERKLKTFDGSSRQLTEIYDEIFRAALSSTNKSPDKRASPALVSHDNQLKGLEETLTKRKLTEIITRIGRVETARQKSRLSRFNRDCGAK
jgi:hypothetical protein